MRIPGWSLLISLGLHLLLMLLLIYLKTVLDEQQKFLEVPFFILDNSKSQDIPPHPILENESVFPIPDQNGFHEDSMTDNSKDTTTIQQESLLNLRARDYAFLHHESISGKDDFRMDSLNASIMDSLCRFKSAWGDPGEELMGRRNTGTDPLRFHLTDLIPKSSGKVIKEFKLDFIPTESQIRALNHLFDRGATQDTDLYPVLVTGKYQSFEMYREEMDRMVNKGLISKEKVSPEQLFILFVIPIEMSAKNRKNPEYKYEPLFKKKTLIDFLQAKLYAAQKMKEDMKQDSVMLNLRIEEISKKLKILLD